MSASSADALLANGEARAALQALHEDVRSHASDAKLRVFLFQLLCVLKQWDRAAKQLEVCGELDAANLALVAVYQRAIESEAERGAVFEGRRAPTVLGPCPAWIADLIEALAADARDDRAEAARLRAQAFDAAQAVPGTLDGKPFGWLADADSRLGPVLEAVVEGQYRWVPFESLAQVAVDAPTDLRDCVWTPARIRLHDGAEHAALLPVRYAESRHDIEDEPLLLARRTEWIAVGAEQYRGIGQRVLTTDDAEVGLLEVRSLTFASPATHTA